MVYLMRRRIDKRLEEVCQEVAFLKDRLTETVDGRNMDRISFKEKLAEAEKNLEVTKNNAVILLTQNEVLVKKQKDFDQMKEELAKVREYIGKERYDAIVATARLEKMAGSQA